MSQSAGEQVPPGDSHVRRMDGPLNAFSDLALNHKEKGMMLLHCMSYQNGWLGIGAEFHLGEAAAEKIAERLSGFKLDEHDS